MGFRPSASALRVTKRVCGIGPSTASTSSRTLSTIPGRVRLRRRSPRARGVDDIDVRAFVLHRAVLRQNCRVMPAFWFSRKSFESITRSASADGRRRCRTDAGAGRQKKQKRGLAVVDVGNDGDVADSAWSARLMSRRSAWATPATASALNSRKRAFINPLSVWVIPGGT
jgi:hypothetical protein